MQHQFRVVFITLSNLVSDPSEVFVYILFPLSGLSSDFERSVFNFSLVLASLVAITQAVFV